MKGKLGDKKRMQHILDACKKIQIATEDYDEQRFLNDFIISAAVCNFIMIIGESSARITQEFKEKNTQLDWELMRGMRNIIVHEYFEVDDRQVWDTVVNDVPKLIAACENVLKEIE